MNRTLRNLQLWLNAHGANLLPDGIPGPNTRAAIIETFRNTKAPAANRADLVMIAERLGCDVRQLAAVAAVEGGGNGWDNAGRLKLLWERHYLWRRVRVAVPFLSNPKSGGYTIDADRDGINDSWEKLAEASMRFGFNVAAECASWGKFQIMGAHWKALGYPSIAQFAWGMSRDEVAHYEAFARYIEVNRLVGALRKINGNAANARDFARKYNGPAYERYNYHVKIADAWRRL